MAGGGGGPHDPLAAAVRRHDADRYIATLYAPEPSRAALWAIYAFAAELAQIPAQVSQSPLGEIRLEWWRTVIDETGNDQSRAMGHPVADALGPILQEHPIIEGWLRGMIEGRVADLYTDPIGDMAALEAYFGATLSLPIRVASYVLAPGAAERSAADAAGHGGVALGLVRMASHFPDVVGRRPELIPLEILTARGVAIADLRAANRGPAARALLSDLHTAALAHLDRAARAARALPPAALPALLPLAPLRGDLSLIAKRGPKTAEPVRRGALYRQWSMWRTARRGAIQ